MKAVAELGPIKEILKRSNLFQGLNGEELDKLLPLCREEVYQTGALVSSEGDTCRMVYIVESGRVALEMNLHISRTAENATIDVVTQGGCLCASGLIDPYTLSTTNRTLERTNVIALDAAELGSLFEHNPELGCKAMTNVARVVFSRFQHTKEMMEHILSVIFHDLKAPLAAVESYNRILLGEFAGELNEEQQNIVQRSSKRLSELLNLISNMIDFSRVDFGDLRMERTSVVRLVEDCIDIMHPLASEKGLELLTEMPPELPAISGSPDRLKQVVTNLLSNAIKFTPSGGMITVKVEDDIDGVRVEVVDTGIGIPAEELPRIFDGLYRGLDMAGRGAGLGLSISKRIIEAHYGRIWAVSPCPESGKGSKFTFVLPKKAEESEN